MESEYPFLPTQSSQGIELDFLSRGDMLLRIKNMITPMHNKEAIRGRNPISEQRGYPAQNQKHDHPPWTIKRSSGNPTRFSEQRGYPV
jgi:hypothetical protein